MAWKRVAEEDDFVVLFDDSIPDDDERQWPVDVAIERVDREGRPYLDALSDPHPDDLLAALTLVCRKLARAEERIAELEAEAEAARRAPRPV